MNEFVKYELYNSDEALLTSSHSRETITQRYMDYVEGGAKGIKLFIVSCKELHWFEDDGDNE